MMDWTAGVDGDDRSSDKPDEVDGGRSMDQVTGVDETMLALLNVKGARQYTSRQRREHAMEGGQGTWGGMKGWWRGDFWPDDGEDG
ncbi:hypothetical protein E2562_005537 [Oryza meyeriana var. granulata]|uniref:Uncharacterized protein n=1 Tax=Oryza meyeriana var. granulata TaxID=110450 RepID=A0A6G1F3U5_9ORYZ|nr:hypothetical protein E2562_005537 [Oryza meyeriana var. granulata]